MPEQKADSMPSESTPLITVRVAPMGEEADGENESSTRSSEQSSRFWRRYLPFSCFSAGSVGSSVVNLGSATLGSGAVALPWATSQCGWVLSMMLLVAAACCCAYSIHLLVRVCEQSGCYSYEELARKAGGRVLGFVTQAAVLVFCIGGAVGAIIVAGDILQPLMEQMLMGDDGRMSGWNLLQSKTMLQLLLTIFIMLPLSFLTRINSLRVFSLVACSGVALLAFMLATKAVTMHESGKGEDDNGRPDGVKSIRIDSNILLALPIMMFAYTCQVNVFAIYSELRPRRPSTMHRAVLITVLCETSLYFLIGLGGYALYGDDVKGNILRSLPSEDVTAVISKLCIAVTVVLTFPLNIFPARFTIQDILQHHQARRKAKEMSEARRLEQRDVDGDHDGSFDGTTGVAAMFDESRNGTTSSTKEAAPPPLLTSNSKSRLVEVTESRASLLSRFHSVVLSVSLVGGSFMIAVFTPGVSELFALLGATAGAIISFILPAAFYLILIPRMKDGRMSAAQTNNIDSNQMEGEVQDGHRFQSNTDGVANHTIASTPSNLPLPSSSSTSSSPSVKLLGLPSPTRLDRIAVWSLLVLGVVLAILTTLRTLLLFMEEHEMAFAEINK